MTKVKILLAMILKDDTELEMATRMFKSFTPHFDGLAVAITGPSGKHEKIKALVKKFKGKYISTSPDTHPSIYSDHEGKKVFSNFAAARNVSFKLAEEMQKEHNYDWWAWADVDDVLVNGQEMRDAGLTAKDKAIDSIFFPYWYAVKVKPDGTFTENEVIISHLRERLVKPNVFKWVSRLHEVLVPIDGNYQSRNTVYDWNSKEGRQCAWVHLTDEDRVGLATQRNIRILELQAKEEGRKDPRTIFYLAKTYYDMRTVNYDTLAQELIKEYLHGEYASGWKEERSNACEYMANIEMRRNDHRKAIEWLHESLKEYGGRHMPVLLLAKEYAEVGEFDQSEYWLDVAVNMGEPTERTTIGSPMDVKYTAASLKYNNEIRKLQNGEAGALDKAIYWLKVRNEIAGIDDSLLPQLEEAKEREKTARAIFDYAKWLKDHKYSNYIDPLLKALPPELGKEPFAAFIANEIAEPKKWDKNSIVYYASWGTEHFEGWSPNSLKKGIGGSETAVIQLAKQWAKKGYDVTVYGDPREEAGEYEGVTYRPWYDINWKDEFNILILWRSPHLLTKELKSNKLFYDAHDIESQLNWDEQRMKKIDKVFFKSRWHRNHIPKLPNEKAVIISNGI